MVVWGAIIFEETTLGLCSLQLIPQDRDIQLWRSSNTFKECFESSHETLRSPKIKDFDQSIAQHNYTKRLYYFYAWISLLWLPMFQFLGFVSYRVLHRGQATAMSLGRAKASSMANMASPRNAIPTELLALWNSRSAELTGCWFHLCFNIRPTCEIAKDSWKQSKNNKQKKKHHS